MLTSLNLKLCCCSHVTQTIIVRALTTGQLKEYYDLLNVQKTSTPKEIKDSFLKLSKIYHPDNKTTGSHLRFVQLKEAYDAIKDGPPASSDTDRSAKHNSYANYDDHEDLSHKAHAYYREKHREYANPRPPFSSYGRSQTPWEDFQRDREYYKRKKDYERFTMGKAGSSLTSLTIVMAAVAWIVIYSSILLIWDSNSSNKRTFETSRARSYSDYIAYKEFIRRKEMQERRQKSRPVRERMSTKLETVSDTVAPVKEEPIVHPNVVAEKDFNTEMLEDDTNYRLS